MITEKRSISKRIEVRDVSDFLCNGCLDKTDPDVVWICEALLLELAYAAQAEYEAEREEARRREHEEARWDRD